MKSSNSNSLREGFKNPPPQKKVTKKELEKVLEQARRGKLSLEELVDKIEKIKEII
ncbi:MAG: hypothetical protein ACOC5T_07125 [Elusimicrobiota bacterium]